jgi:hypothetical protein
LAQKSDELANLGTCAKRHSAIIVKTPDFSSEMECRLVRSINIFTVGEECIFEFKGKSLLATCSRISPQEMQE